MTPKNELLVVEDVKETLTGMMLRLEADGWDVVDLAEDIDTAAEKLRDRPYRLLLLDWQLPRRGGEMVADGGGLVLEALKKGEYGTANHNIPFMIVTTPGRFNDHDRVAKYQGYRGVFFKEDDVRRLLATVNGFLPGRRGEHAATEVTQRVWRTLVRVVSISGEGRQAKIAAIVPGWRPDVTVGFDMELVAPRVRRVLERRRFPVWLLAMANLKAESKEELGLEAFELAPDPVSEGDLG